MMPILDDQANNLTVQTDIKNVGFDQTSFKKA